VVRPRQVRYQAALRPDMYCTVDSKKTFHSYSTPDLVFKARTVHELCTNAVYCIMTVHFGARLVGAISFARRLSFSKARASSAASSANTS